MAITPTRCEKDGWSKVAQDAFAAGENRVGYTFSAAAALREGAAMDVALYDALQSRYRDWLINGGACFAESAR